MLVSELLRRSTSVGVSLDKEGFSFGGQRLALGSDGTVVTCTIGGVTMELVSNEPGLLDLLATASQTWRAPGEADGRQVCPPALVLRAVEKCVQFDPWFTVPRWRRNTS